MTHGAGSGTGALRFSADAAGMLLWPVDAGEPRPEWFEPPALGASALARAGGTGRAATTVFEAAGRTLVLRHYRRGGAVRDLLGDRYLRCGVRYSRPARELRLLAFMHARGLPVPPPVAGRVRPSAPMSPFYTADLITGYLPDTATLSAALQHEPLSAAAWSAIGATVARFHAEGIDHADLNAHNVLVDGAGRIYLIDFDRGRRRRTAGRWRVANLRRLRRSLDKLAASGPGLHFGPADWRALEAGYCAPEGGGAASSSPSRAR